MAKDKDIKNKVEKKNLKKDYIHAVGRRKESVARVRLYPTIDSVSWGDILVKKGDVFINKKPIEEYFKSETEEIYYKEPFRITNTLGKFLVTIKVRGGGKAGQLDAVIHGISRVLEKLDTEKFRPILKKKGMLTRDARVRQRRMVGMGGKSRRKKQSPKR